MKRSDIKFPELLNIFAFLLYLLGSSIALIKHGIELSLWLMTFAVVIQMTRTLLPWFGIRWLALEMKGCKLGFWLANIIYFSTWGSFAYAMILRFWRNLSRFYTVITITNLLWALGLLVFIYSRHACSSAKTDDNP